MQLTELTDCSSSILMVQRSRKNGFPFLNRIKRGAMHEQIATAFQANGEVGQVTVHHLTSISLMATMHEDICHVAGKKGVAMIILPFHKRWGREDEEVTEDSGQGWREVNRKVLQNVPCSVAVLVYRGGARRYEQEPKTSDVARKRELDEEAINEFKAKWQESVEYIEKNATNITEEVLSIGKAKDYDLVIVGKQQQIESTKLTNIDFRPEH
ncbi:hypothetical protein JHK87_053809 [Glycine soja]|nr:hypothetical protein JHK87_053809 [Glycine soja]